MIRPAFPSPPHARFGAGEAMAWVVRPPGGVVQLTAEIRGTRELAQWIAGPALQTMLNAYPQQDAFIIVLDLSLMQSRDPAARALLLDKARELQPRVSRTYIVPPLQINPVLRTTLHAAVALLSSIGVRIEVAASAAEVVERLQLQPLALPAAR